MSRELPHITVAAVVEKDGRFLMVEEKSDGRVVFNQPAGHMEVGETLEQAVVREVLEETAWRVEPTALLGLETFAAPNGITYVRVTFIAKAIAEENSPLDDDIMAAHWLDEKTIIQMDQAGELRSPLVLRAVRRYLDNIHYPLDMLGAF